MGEGRDMCLEGKFPIEHKKDTGAVIYIVSKREGERRLRGECNCQTVARSGDSAFQRIEIILNDQAVHAWVIFRSVPCRRFI